MAEKQCRKCKCVKQMEAFSKCVTNPDGHQYWCRKCVSEYQQTPEVRARSNRKRRTYQSRNPISRLKCNMKTKYGLAFAEYEKMLNMQQGLCAICNNAPPPYKRLGVDHCHDTKVVRGLLCDNCNQGLGKFKDAPALLLRAATYLERFR